MCDLVLTKIQVELYSKDGNGKYAALALSDDPRMGDDLVLFCSEVSEKILNILENQQCF